uniref:Uncharacterized protein n=1 Tax=Rhizophora mucronata TaxID=61149 RepID=A0A2P2PIY8_RHIMU
MVQAFIQFPFTLTIRYCQQEQRWLLMMFPSICMVTSNKRKMVVVITVEKVGLKKLYLQ